jgi:hypothetical protein
MSVKTVRFNKSEESKLKALLRFYKADFSQCVKELIAEKLEDLQDIGFIARIKEGKRSAYLTGQEISSLFR